MSDIEETWDEPRDHSDDEEELDDQENWDDFEDPDFPSLGITKSLYDDETFSTPEECISYDSATHGVDLLNLIRRLRISSDPLSTIRLINFIRDEKPSAQRLESLAPDDALFSSPKYLQPIVPDDSLLQFDFEVLGAGTENGGANAVGPSTESRIRHLENLVVDLTSRLDDSNGALERLRRIALQNFDLEEQSGSSSSQRKIGGTSSDYSNDGKKTRVVGGGSSYFHSYGATEIHETMLKDTVRTLAYKTFITQNPSFIQGKAVLDVGCGTGILSMMAARAGARKVYAVDASSIAFKAERNVRENGLDGIVQVIHGKIEEIELPEKVDVIVSEWMGYFLLYESMLDSVLTARNKFLSPGGVIGPYRSIIKIAPVANVLEEHQQFWNNQYGFKMTSMTDELTDEVFQLQEKILPSEKVLTEPTIVKDLQIQKLQQDDILPFSSHFRLEGLKKSATVIAGFAGWFDVEFPGVDGSAFSVGPDIKTHWGSSIFQFKIPVNLKPGQIIEGDLTCSRAGEDGRGLEVTIILTAPEERSQMWTMY